MPFYLISGASRHGREKIVDELRKRLCSKAIIFFDKAQQELSILIETSRRCDGAVMSVAIANPAIEASVTFVRDERSIFNNKVHIIFDNEQGRSRKRKRKT